MFIDSPTSHDEWDLKQNNRQDMKDAAGYLIEHLPSLVPLGAPLWPLETCTLYERWASGLVVDMSVWVVTTDASVDGVAMCFGTVLATFDIV